MARASLSLTGLPAYLFAVRSEFVRGASNVARIQKFKNLYSHSIVPVELGYYTFSIILNDQAGRMDANIQPLGPYRRFSLCGQFLPTNHLGQMCYL